MAAETDRIASAEPTVGTTVARALGQWWTVLAGAVIGVVVALLLYDHRLLAGNPSVWGAVGGDAGSGLAGFRYFVGEPWGWPPLRISSLGEASSVATTDSIALLAVVAKLTRFTGLAAEDWWGGWFALTSALQGACAVLAIRAFGVRRWWIELAMAALAVTSPILLFRAVHPGLMAQSTVLLGLAVVGWMQRWDRPMRAAWIGSALVVASPLVHPYFLPMTMGLVGAAVIDGWSRRAISSTAAGVWAATTSILLGAVLLLGGMIQGDRLPDDQGFVTNTTFLLGPVVPQLSELWPGGQAFAHPFSGEGFAFLGVGILALLAAALVLHRSRVGAIVRRHQVLVTAVVIMWMAAVSVRVVVRDTTIWDLRAVDLMPFVGAAAAVGALVALGRRSRPIGPAPRRTAAIVSVMAAAAVAATFVPEPTDPDHRRAVLSLLSIAAAAVLGRLARDPLRRPWRVTLVIGAAVLATLGTLGLLAPGVVSELTSSFRAPGRLVWPMWYLLLLASLAGLSRQRARIAVPIVAAACLLQAVDVSPLYGRGDEVTLPSPSRVEYMARLQSVVGHHQAVHLEPPMACTLSAPGGFDAFRDTIMAASLHLVPVDQELSARARRVDCPAGATVDERDGVLTVLVPPFAAPAAAAVPDGVECGQLDVITLCSSDPGSLAALTTPPGAD